MEIFENFVWTVKTELFENDDVSVGTSLPREKATRKVNLNLQNGEGYYATKRSRISEYFVWHDSQSTFFEVLETLYSIVSLRSSSTSSSVLLVPSDLPGYCPTCDIFELFLANFQVPNKDRHAKRQKKAPYACSVSGISVFVWTGENDSKTLLDETNFFEKGEKKIRLKDTFGGATS